MKMPIVTYGQTFVHEGITSSVKRVKSLSDRMSSIILRGCYCDSIIVKVHAPSEDKTDDTKQSFYEELQHVLYQIPKYHMKILLRDFNKGKQREQIFSNKNQE
jgi:hypothetical protein